MIGMLIVCWLVLGREVKATSNETNQSQTAQQPSEAAKELEIIKLTLAKILVKLDGD